MIETSVLSVIEKKVRIMITLIESIHLLFNVQDAVFVIEPRPFRGEISAHVAFMLLPESLLVFLSALVVAQ